MNGAPATSAPNLLGGLSNADFLSQYWQQKPLLVRDALPDYRPPITADELAGLACEPEVESRLVETLPEHGRWRLAHGPFASDRLAALPDKDWTLLVQGLELWIPELRALLQAFDFLPRWRLDDIMASFAVPGGSVGPHYDQYDVFLLQVEGTRTWQIGTACEADATLATESDLRILADFEALEQWQVKPGDMLYLPPLVSHWGIADSACMTFSIGARSPRVADMLSDLATELLARDEPSHYRDPPLTPEMATDTIHPAFIAQTQALLNAVLADDALIADWFARYMTAPKYPDLIGITDERRTARVGTTDYVNGEPEDASAQTPTRPNSD